MVLYLGNIPIISVCMLLFSWQTFLVAICLWLDCLLGGKPGHVRSNVFFVCSKYCLQWSCTVARVFVCTVSWFALLGGGVRV